MTLMSGLQSVAYTVNPEEGRALVALVIEDDPAVAQLLVDVLCVEAYNVTCVTSAAAAKALLREVQPDLIILDLMLPDGDGLILCSDLKSRTAAPIIVCSASNRKRDSVLALRLGADDFIAKPFDVDELLTRIDAARRRMRSPVSPAAAVDGTSEAWLGADFTTQQDPNSGAIHIGPLTLDHERRRVTLAGHELRLTPTEYRLLSIVSSRPDVVFSRQELAKQVWGYDDPGIGRSIDVHMHRLRAKMHAAQSALSTKKMEVVSARGFGFRLAVSPAGTAQLRAA
jgi:DNA-binding response OmpR family regulator